MSFTLVNSPNSSPVNISPELPVNISPELSISIKSRKKKNNVARSVEPEPQLRVSGSAGNNIANGDDRPKQTSIEIMKNSTSKNVPQNGDISIRKVRKRYNGGNKETCNPNKTPPPESDRTEPEGDSIDDNNDDDKMKAALPKITPPPPKGPAKTEEEELLHIIESTLSLGFDKAKEHEGFQKFCKTKKAIVGSVVDNSHGPDNLSLILGSNHLGMGSPSQKCKKEQTVAVNNSVVIDPGTDIGGSSSREQSSDSALAPASDNEKSTTTDDSGTIRPENTHGLSVQDPEANMEVNRKHHHDILLRKRKTDSRKEGSLPKKVRFFFFFFYFIFFFSYSFPW